MQETLNKPKVQLTGRNGNAYEILAQCRRAAINAGWTQEQITAALDEMKSGDYDNLLVTAMRLFDVE